MDRKHGVYIDRELKRFFAPVSLLALVISPVLLCTMHLQPVFTNACQFSSVGKEKKCHLGFAGLPIFILWPTL